MGLKQKLTAPIVWGNLLAMLVVAILSCIGIWKGMEIYTHHGESIEVPQLVGMQENDAYYKLNQLELHGVVVDSAYNKDLPPGAILEQVPTAGRKVKSGREIFLTVNTEKRPTRALSDMADKSAPGAARRVRNESMNIFKLTAIGFKLGPVEYVNGDRDWVYGVKCRDRNIYAGEQTPLDVPLVLQVGRGVSDLEELVEEDGEEEEFVEEEIIAPDETD